MTGRPTATSRAIDVTTRITLAVVRCDGAVKQMDGLPSPLRDALVGGTQAAACVAGRRVRTCGDGHARLLTVLETVAEAVLRADPRTIADGVQTVHDLVAATPREMAGASSAWRRMWRTTRRAS